MNNGGFAFPRPASRGNNYMTGEEDVVVDPQQGMTLRDYFAAKAMQANLTNPELMKVVTSSEVIGAEFADRLANISYKYADAMLKARME
jgi:hypothetical protein